jgi:hypothetical protein
VFWYDAKHELRAEFEALLLPEVETIELSHNEFAVKHRVLRGQPVQNCLYFVTVSNLVKKFHGPQPVQ